MTKHGALSGPATVASLPMPNQTKFGLALSDSQEYILSRQGGWTLGRQQQRRAAQQ